MPTCCSGFWLGMQSRLRILLALVGTSAMLMVLQAAANAQEDAPPVAEEAADVPVEEAVVADVVVQEVAVPALQAEAIMMPDPEQQRKALETQFTEQYRPLLLSELYLLRVVCNPSKEQGEKLTEAGNEALEAAAKKTAQVQMNMMQGRFAIFPGNNAYPNPRKIIHEGMQEPVKKILNSDQYALYEKEAESRMDARKHALVDYMTARIDADLALTREQRDEIRQSLLSNWDEAWDQSIEMVIYGESFLPVIPGDIVTKHLTERQSMIWLNQNSNRGAVMGGVPAMLPGAAVQGIEILWDAPVDVVPPEVDQHDP